MDIFALSSNVIFYVVTILERSILPIRYNSALHLLFTEEETICGI